MPPLVERAPTAPGSGEREALATLRGRGGELAAKGDPVCVVRDDAGAVVAVSFAVSSVLPPVAGLPFWLTGLVADDPATAPLRELLATTFEALRERTPVGPGHPLGLALLLGDPERRALPAEAHWEDPDFVYAGYLENGRQLRLGYFPGAMIGSGRAPLRETRPLDPGLRICAYPEQDTVDDDAVIAMWVDAGSLDRDEARRRVRNLSHVAIDAAGRPVGAATLLLVDDPRLHASLWYQAISVVPSQRGGHVGRALAFASFGHLIGRWNDGTDRRGFGLLYIVQNPGVRTRLSAAVWPHALTFVGFDERGHHVRVLWFDGAPAPEPPPG